MRAKRLSRLDEMPDPVIAAMLIVVSASAGSATMSRQTTLNGHDFISRPKDDSGDDAPPYCGRPRSRALIAGPRMSPMGKSGSEWRYSKYRGLVHFRHKSQRELDWHCAKVISGPTPGLVSLRLLRQDGVLGSYLTGVSEDSCFPYRPARQDHRSGRASVGSEWLYHLS